MKTLSVENLSVYYQTDDGLVAACQNISLEVHPGECIAVWGHSGCGKSSLFKALVGIEQSEPGVISGSVRFQNSLVTPSIADFVKINGSSEICKDTVGYRRRHRQLVRPLLGGVWRVILQEPIYSFEPAATLDGQVQSIIQHISERTDIAPSELHKEFVESLRRLKLEADECLVKHNRQLSGGECQRISVALSLLGHPALLLADEPTTALDDHTRQTALEIMQEHKSRDGLAVVLATHSRRDILTLADRIYVLYRGRIVESFAKQALLEEPIENFHPYTQQLWFAVDPNLVETAAEPSKTRAINHQGCPYHHACRFPATDKALSVKCQRSAPPMFQVGKSHLSACWLMSDRPQPVPDEASSEIVEGAA